MRLTDQNHTACIMCSYFSLINHETEYTQWVLTVVKSCTLTKVWNVTPVMWLCLTTLGTKALLNPWPSLCDYGWKHIKHVSHSLSLTLSLSLLPFPVSKTCKDKHGHTAIYWANWPVSGKPRCSNTEHNKQQTMPFCLPVQRGEMTQIVCLWLWMKISDHLGCLCVWPGLSEL